MASRLTHRPARAVLSALAKQPAARGANTMAPLSTAIHSRPQTFTQSPAQIRTLSITSFPSEALQLKASADQENRAALTTAVADAVSASGAFLSQTQDMLSETVFVMDSISSEKLAAFHSLLESMRVSLDHSTQKVLEECYFSLLQQTEESQSSGGASSTAVLQLNWKH